MVLQKRKALRIFFGLELTVFLWSYLFGSHGWYAIWQLSYEAKKVASSIAALQYDIQEHKEKIQCLLEHDFYKEQIAREKLQMAKAGEKVYYY